MFTFLLCTLLAAAITHTYIVHQREKDITLEENMRLLRLTFSYFGKSLDRPEPKNLPYKEMYAFPRNVGRPLALC